MHSTQSTEWPSSFREVCLHTYQTPWRTDGTKDAESRADIGLCITYQNYMVGLLQFPVWPMLIPLLYRRLPPCTIQCNII